MPLVKSPSKKAFGKNVSKEVKAGKPIKQALAIAYSEKKAAGGMDGKAKPIKSGKQMKWAKEKKPKKVESDRGQFGMK